MTSLDKIDFKNIIHHTTKGQDNWQVVKDQMYGAFKKPEPPKPQYPCPNPSSPEWITFVNSIYPAGPALKVLISGTIIGVGIQYTGLVEFDGFNYAVYSPAFTKFSSQVLGALQNDPKNLRTGVKVKGQVEMLSPCPTLLTLDYA
jgi:hypothetical protein